MKNLDWNLPKPVNASMFPLRNYEERRLKRKSNRSLSLQHIRALRQWRISHGVVMPRTIERRGRSFFITLRQSFLAYLA